MCCAEFDNCSSPLLTVKHTMELGVLQEEEVTNVIHEQAAAHVRRAPVNPKPPPIKDIHYR